MIEYIDNLVDLMDNIPKKIQEGKKIEAIEIKTGELLSELKLSNFFKIGAAKKIAKLTKEMKDQLSGKNTQDESIQIIMEYYKQFENLFAFYGGDRSSQLQVKSAMYKLTELIQQIAKLRFNMENIEPAPAADELLIKLNREFLKDKPRKR